ncbi:MAG TPA: DUF1329 domain-containing protein [Nevskiales bacterium]|nr:DUF1329 domain-containing protein [Nevskiales bacterium]
MSTMRSATALAAIILSFVSGLALAKVSPEEAERLKNDLMPLGGERAGNADGSIPAWDGGRVPIPADFKGDGHMLVNPFPDDKPLYTITKANLDQYKSKLSPGHIAMFGKYPDYKMHVYPTRRTASAPDFVYEATYKNALTAELGSNGEALLNAVTGIPFPIPKSGKEPIWNHKVRYRGLGGTRYNVQAAVQANGSFTPAVLREDARFHYNYPNIKPEDLNNIIIYFFQLQTAPARVAGTITLVHETMDQVKETRRAWLYNPGQRRLRRAPNVAYDNPGNASDGLRTNDQLDMFNGAMDRYDWKIIGKQELIVPYNAYELRNQKYKYTDICKAGHINQDLARYELHRVWVVEANQREGTRHIYKKRISYIDEDSWSMLVTALYDQRDQLWRFQEGHVLSAYHKPFLAMGVETVYDLLNNRYLALGMSNEHPEAFEKEFPVEYFDPANVIKQAQK